jgi:hypothetical protein
MQCPFCTANIPAGSELCPHCMSDLRNQSPRGDRATATDGGGKTGYVPPRQGYVPPTHPWGNEPEAPNALGPTLHAAEDQPPAPGQVPVALSAGYVPAAPQPPASPYAVPFQPAPTAASFQPAPTAAPPQTAVSAYAPVQAPPANQPPQPFPQPVPVQPVPAQPAPAAAPPQVAGRETVRHQPQAPAAGGRRQTALDPDQGIPRFEGVRGRTRLDKDEARVAGAPQVGRRVVGWMISFDVNLEGQEYVIREGKNTVGRARDADISVFYDDRVSATHATIVYRNGECRLRDEMTNNGTFVNGQDVGPGGTVSLKSGDVLRVGRCTFKLYLLDPGEVTRLWPHIGTATGG